MPWGKWNPVTEDHAPGRVAVLPGVSRKPHWVLVSDEGLGKRGSWRMKQLGPSSEKSQGARCGWRGVVRGGASRYEMGGERQVGGTWDLLGLWCSLRAE